MGFIQNGQMIAAQNGVRATKKLAKLQEAAAKEAEEREQALLQLMRRQTDLLTEIRDLLKAQQRS